ncbi:Tad3p [Sugiyamaella lignohabitans]|uniref:Tad3p n=1 Tax=Sugiyamaella lignohabitans TaxID=796027 RepID=A0A167CRK6_9ASCO|nr:Tad3p [Sugiyamaella lignohabitans]ANB12024.1 Tad3p [Sugiyamaella lignohabitans]
MWRGNPNAIRNEITSNEVEAMRKHLKSLVQLSKQHAPGELPISTLIVDPETDTVVVSNSDARHSNGNPINHSIMVALYDAAILEAERRRQLSAERSSRSSSLRPDEVNSRASTPSLNVNNINNSQSLNGTTTISCATTTTVTSTTIDNLHNTDLSPPGLMTASSASVSSASTLNTLDQLSPDDKNYLCLNMHVYTTHEPCPMCAMALVHSRIARLIYIKPSPKTGAIEPTSGASYGVHWNKLLNWKYEAWRWQADGYLATDDDKLISSVEDISPDING